MKTDLVTTEILGHVGLMRFNNPEELNTLQAVLQIIWGLLFACAILYATVF